MPYTFPGFPGFLAEAGKPYSQPARTRALRNAGLHGLSRLLAQASAAEPRDRAGIMVHAEEHLEALRLVVATGEAMHAQVEAEIMPPKPKRKDKP